MHCAKKVYACIISVTDGSTGSNNNELMVAFDVDWIEENWKVEIMLDDEGYINIDLIREEEEDDIKNSDNIEDGIKNMTAIQSKDVTIQPPPTIKRANSSSSDNTNKVKFPLFLIVPPVECSSQK